MKLHFFLLLFTYCSLEDNKAGNSQGRLNPKKSKHKLCCHDQRVLVLIQLKRLTKILPQIFALRGVVAAQSKSCSTARPLPQPAEQVTQISDKCSIY